MNTCTTCQGGTRRYYGTHCPECAHPNPVTARPATKHEHAEQTRHSIDPQDTDGGTIAAGIENEAESLGGIGGRLSAFARSLGARPEWTDSPAVQAWHRNDGHTEHDGAPVNPRIWSPDYRTTERWSTPSLRNVHWSDLVDVTPLRAVENESRACPDPDAHWRIVEAFERAEKAEGESDVYKKLHRGSLRGLAEMEEERDMAQSALKVARRDLEERQAATKARFNEHEATIDEQQAVIEALRDDLARAETINREVTDAMIQRAWQVNSDLLPSTIGRMLTAALTEPTRPHGAEAIEAAIRRHRTSYPGDQLGDLADLLAEDGIRVVSGERP